MMNLTKGRISDYCHARCDFSVSIGKGVTKSLLSILAGTAVLVGTKVIIGIPPLNGAQFLRKWSALRPSVVEKMPIGQIARVPAN